MAERLDTYRMRGWMVAHPLPALLAFLALFALTLLQQGPGLWVKDLWFSDELRLVGVLLEYLKGGDWLALRLDGTLYPDMPPIYFWYPGALLQVFGREPWVIYLGIAGTAWAFALAIWHIGLRIIGDAELALVAARIAVHAALILTIVPMTFPPLNKQLSPAAVADVMRPLAGAGYAPGVFQGNDGVFAYYLGMHYRDFQSLQEAAHWLQQQPRTVISMSAPYRDLVIADFPGLQPVACIQLAGDRVLVAQYPASGTSAELPCGASR